MTVAALAIAAVGVYSQMPAQVTKPTAETGAAAKNTTLVIKTDTTCKLSINGEDRGTLEAQVTQRLPVDPGELLIECVHDGRRVEQTETVKAGRQAVVQLNLPPPGPKKRFERVAEGVKDNEQGLIWAERDNSIDINWKDATKNCSSYGDDWTLPSSGALQSIFDASGTRSAPHDIAGTAYTAKLATPLITFSGIWYWTSEENGASEAFVVDFGNDSQQSHAIDYKFLSRAMCVRRS